MIKKLVFAAAISLMAVPQASAWNDLLNSVWGSKGNDTGGILLSDLNSSTAGVTGDVVQGNYIGITPSSAPDGNTGDGGLRPNPHSACTARTAFSRPSRLTTTAMVNSLDPCAIAMIFTCTREIAVKIRPAMPGLPCTSGTLLPRR